MCDPTSLRTPTGFVEATAETEMTVEEMILQMSVKMSIFFKMVLSCSRTYYGVCAVVGALREAVLLPSSAGGDHVDWAFVTFFLCCGE